MSTWKGARNSYSKGSCRVTWTLTAQRLGHAMDWRLAMSAGRRLGPSKAGSGWTGARGVRKAITRLEVPLAAGARGAGPARRGPPHLPAPRLLGGPRAGPTRVHTLGGGKRAAQRRPETRHHRGA